MNDSISTVIINFQTPDLLKVAVESFRYYYPQIDLLIVDNGSKDNSLEVICELEKLSPKKTRTVFFKKNIYHGPAMHRVMSAINKKYVFFLDSDTETKECGFLEQMQTELETSTNIYGIGQQVMVNKRGFQVEKGAIILAPAYMMLHRSLYFTLPPFERHGQPVLKNFIVAQQRGYLLKPFPIEKFIKHRWRGTASRFGYGLGLRGKIDFILNKFGV